MKYEKPVLEEIELQLEGSALLCKSDEDGTKPGGSGIGKPDPTPENPNPDPTDPWG